MNSRGFLIYAEGKEYVKQAYLCALSIKASGNKYPVSIVTSNKVLKKHEKAFDKIIKVPWYEASNSRFKSENRWKLYHATPYDQTIVLDSDILVLDNQESFWKFLDNYDLYFPCKVFNYRGNLVDEKMNPYRAAFRENDLPNFYNAVHYFRKSELAHTFYEWVELVTKNWELFYGNFCKEHYPTEPSMDITTSIVSRILDIDDDISNVGYSAPHIKHMKPALQDWESVPDLWQQRIGVYLTDDVRLKVGNHLQNGVFHYTENTFVTAEIIRKYEQCLKR
jgi:hypothetical protein